MLNYSIIRLDEAKKVFYPKLMTQTALMWVMGGGGGGGGGGGWREGGQTGRGGV